MGVTHNAFSERYAKGNPVHVEIEYDDAGDEASRTETPRDIMEWFRHIYVKEVVREPKIHYQRVPRLGSYMAVPLIYNNCLNIESLEEAVRNFQDVEKRKAEQEAERQAFDAKQVEDKAAAEAQGVEFVPETREWEEINLDPFQSVEEKYVVCLDTMGQDREFT